MKLLLNQLKEPNENVADVQRDILQLHRTIMAKWSIDKAKLKPEKTIS